MKRFYVCIAAVAALALTGCNASVIDTTWKYDKAIIVLPNGTVVEGEVTKWTDFEDGDQLQIEIDGKTYLTHASNVVLVSEG